MAVVIVAVFNGAHGWDEQDLFEEVQGLQASRDIPFCRPDKYEQQGT